MLTGPQPWTRRRFLAAGAAGAAAAVAGACAEPAGPAKGAAGAPGTDPGRAAVEPAAVPAAADAGPLVLVTLVGGNDALNTVVPLEDGRYRSARGGLAIDAASALPVGEGFGLHPALVRCKGLWDAGRLAIVHGVGFDGLDRSHFHCMDVWESGGTEAGSTGWVGRWLDRAGADPLAAVVVGTRLPLLARGERTVGTVLTPGPFDLALTGPLEAGYRAQLAPDPARNELEARAAASGADLLEAAARLGGPLADRRPRRGFTHQLRTVADLITADVPIRVFAVQHRGYDTHAGQADDHPRLLATLDAALGELFDAVGDHPVTVVVLSEFGRRVAANGSGGTDHGGAGTVLVAGRVRPGHHGEPPPLDDLVDGDLRTTTQVASVYADLLEGVLGTPAGDVLAGSPRPLGIVP